MSGPTAANITGLILAGGLGVRMGGADKGWIKFRGHPLVLHVLERFAPQVGALIISANRNIDRYESLGVQVLADDADRFGEFQGPLAGIVRAMQAAASDWLAVVPCDAPMLPADLVERLAGALGNAPAAAAWCGGRVQPVFCLLRTDLRTRLEDALAVGVRKPADFLQSVCAIPAHFEDAGAFVNLNAPADLPAGDQAVPSGREPG